jgi:catalase
MHLENPVEHGDIDTNYDYLSKTKQSLENLQQLYQTIGVPKFVKLLMIF